MLENAKRVTEDDLARYRAGYDADPMRQLMTHVFSKTPIRSLSFSPEDGRKMQFLFSDVVPTMTSTNQKSSGRCWLFASTNLLREIVAKECNLEQFEISQAYLAFWDKYERVNYYIQSIIDTASEPLGSRLVDFIICAGVHDGGQWDMFVNLVNKYGVCPKSAMPETFQSSNTGDMNRLLNLYLRRMTPVLRALAVEGKTEELEKVCEEMRQKTYSFLVSCYAAPPTEFSFEYTDKDKKYHIEHGFTPLTFRDRFIGDRLKDYVSIIHAPTADKPFGRTYTVDYLGNIVGGNPVLYLNLPMDEFKALAMQQIVDGELVWFGSDCGNACDNDKRSWDGDAMHDQLLTGFDLAMSKEDMLNYHVSAMNHAMVLCGVNRDENGKPNRWKIENSWGSDGVNGGYYMASDSWFDAYVYQAVIHKKYLDKYADLLAQTPIRLPLWDPMGSLAD